MSETVEVKISEDHAEIVVRPEFYELEHAAPIMWDVAVSQAQAQGYYMVEALVPAIDSRLCMEIDSDGTEHHYLVTRDQVAAFTR